MRSVDHTGDRTEDSSGLSGSFETTYFRVGDHPEPFAARIALFTTSERHLYP